MRWRWLGLILLLVLTTHLSASPLGIATGDWPAASQPTVYVTTSVVKDALPFALEEKSVTAKPAFLTARTHLVVILPSATARVELFNGTAETPVRLAGFQLRVSQRPPPVYF